MIPRRQRHERLIKDFSESRVASAFDDMVRRKGLLHFLDDEAVEELARRLATDHRRVQRMNRRNRALAQTGVEC
jgi:hypothetical protein